MPIPRSSLYLRRVVPCLQIGLILLVLSLSSSAFGQSGSGVASISGRILDAGGSAIPGAKIVVTASQTGLKRTLASDGAGLYSVSSLTVGSYIVEASANGFAPSRVENLMLTVGQDAEINITLKAANVSQTVTVTAETETDLTHRTEVDNATLIGNEVVEDLPTRGRNFTDFALLTPGIVQEGDRFGLVVNGQRSGNVNLSIDGMDFNDPLQNGQRGGSEAVYFFPQVSVREFQVVRTGASAEIGRTNSGFVNVVTKSGTNRFHGEALYTNRNAWLTWPDALNDPEASNNENQYGFGVGGAIRRDKLFFYAGIEKTNFRVPFFVHFTDCPTAGFYDPTGAVPNCTQAAIGTTNPPSMPLPANITAFEVPGYGVNNPLASSGRLDWQINDRNTAMLQYMSTFLSGVAFGASGIQKAAESNNTSYAQQSQAIVLGLTTSLSANRTNEARLQWVYDNRQQAPVDSIPEVDIGDLGTFGGAGDGTFAYRAIREELVDNYTWLKGRHTLRFGFDINLEPETQQREDNAAGLWTIDTFQDYLAALPTRDGGSGLAPANSSGCAASNSCAFRFQQILPTNNGPESRYQGTQREYAAYVQDNFHALSRLTVQLGLRYEAQLEPKPTANPAVPATGVNPNDVTMWQPRAGLAWDVRGNGKTVVRASGGLFDARTPAYIFARNFTDNGIANTTIDSNYDQSLLSRVGYLGAFNTVPSTNSLNEIYTTNPDFKNPRSVQAALAVEQRITKTTVLVVSYTQNETYKLQHRLNTNLFQPTIDAATLYPVFPISDPITHASCLYQGGLVPCHPNNTIGGFHQNFSTAHSTYRSMIVQFKGRITDKIHTTLNYTWAADRDDDSNERDFDRELSLDPLCTACYNKGYAKHDVRDHLSMHVIYHMPKHFVFSSSFVTRTALPYTAVTSGSKQGDFNKDGNSDNDRPILCSQKAFTTCPVSTTQINTDKGAEVGTVVGRNTFRQNGFLNWDMRMLKSFHLHDARELQLSAECLNCSRSSNLNLGGNAVSKFTHAQGTMNPITGYYYSGNNAGFMLDAYDTFRAGGPRQIQLGSRFVF